MIEKSNQSLLDHIGENHSYRSILALNGHLPEANFFQQWTLPVIAADGAVNDLLCKKIRPIAVVGDLDSANLEAIDTIPIVHKPDQNHSDFTKCLNYMKEEDLLPTIVVGMNGGYIDHILNNINLFLNTDSIFYAAPVVGYVLQKGSRHFTLPSDTKLSLLGIPQATLSTKGLKWELQNYQASFPGANSCFNRNIKNKVSITVQEGVCLLLIYL
jgi:thiamine pyrophosphokinase